jgi:hypothetical protein
MGVKFEAFQNDVWNEKNIRTMYIYLKFLKTIIICASTSHFHPL